jgi:putative membrane protein
MTHGAGETPTRTEPARAGAPAVPTTFFGQIRSGLVAALGLGGRQAVEHGHQDVSTGLAQERTDLAVERSYLAAERTLMAWIRTSLSMISFGFTIGKLGQTIADVQVKGLFLAPRMLGVEGIAYFLVILGTLALAGAILQYVRSLAVYAALGLRRRLSISLVVGLVLFLVGALALTALVAKL